MCHLSNNAHPLRMSDLAQYQDALRPTITHRVAHLVKVGFLERSEGEEDKRNVCCSLSSEGKEYLTKTLENLRNNLQTQEIRDSVSLERMCLAVDNSGSILVSSADLIVLAISIDYCATGETVLVGELSRNLGILQPTVSMAVGTLEREGLIKRVSGVGARESILAVALTKKGKQYAQKIAARIEQF